MICSESQITDKRAGNCSPYPQGFGVARRARNTENSALSAIAQRPPSSLQPAPEWPMTTGRSLIFVPLLYIARVNAPGAIPLAAVTTLGLFTVLTAVVFFTRKDFSFLRSFLAFGGIAAMGLIVVAMLFSFNLGPIFIYAVIALACGYILYDTSNVLHQYRIGQHVAAALALFASVALLFYYILLLFMSRRD